MSLGQLILRRCMATGSSAPAALGAVTKGAGGLGGKLAGGGSSRLSIVFVLYL